MFEFQPRVAAERGKRERFTDRGLLRRGRSQICYGQVQLRRRRKGIGRGEKEGNAKNEGKIGKNVI